MEKLLTKLIPCSYIRCAECRRQAYGPSESEEEQLVTVAVNYIGTAYCSIECAMAAKAETQVEMDFGCQLKIGGCPDISGK